MQGRLGAAELPWAAMSSEPARYDAIADWYVEFTKDW
jgi:hypothetical protein